MKNAFDTLDKAEESVCLKKIREAKTDRTQRETYKSTVIAKDFNTFLSVTDISKRQKRKKISKDRVELKTPSINWI